MYSLCGFSDLEGSHTYDTRHALEAPSPLPPLPHDAMETARPRAAAPLTRQPAAEAEAPAKASNSSSSSASIGRSEASKGGGAASRSTARAECRPGRRLPRLCFACSASAAPMSSAAAPRASACCWLRSGGGSPPGPAGANSTRSSTRKPPPPRPSRSPKPRPRRAPSSLSSKRSPKARTRKRTNEGPPGAPTPITSPGRACASSTTGRPFSTVAAASPARCRSASVAPARETSKCSGARRLLATASGKTWTQKSSGCTASPTFSSPSTQVTSKALASGRKPHNSASGKATEDRTCKVKGGGIDVPSIRMMDAVATSSERHPSGFDACFSATSCGSRSSGSMATSPRGGVSTTVCRGEARRHCPGLRPGPIAAGRRPSPASATAPLPSGRKSMGGSSSSSSRKRIGGSKSTASPSG
mmetsp:Transcript_130380/g.417062  ORF Transcript_130380/g.417062 Transcript_130380/m.417062 type:complete len:416 (+) Transcript_130380:91-1338(+)